MKKYFVLFLFVFLFASCGSIRIFPVKVNPDSEIGSNQVPWYITAAFQVNYPGIVPEKWFLKHEKYIARFMMNGSTKYAVYNKSGGFDVEEIDDPYYDEFYDESDDVYDWEYWDELYN